MFIILQWMFADAATELKQYFKALTLLFAMDCNFKLMGRSACIILAEVVEEHIVAY